MKKLNKITFLAILLGFAACTNLDVTPKSSAVADVVFTDPAAYKQFLAKVYGGLAIGGQLSGDDNSDITGINGGFSQYIRQLYDAQELSTDEAVIGWNDGTIQTFHFHEWTASGEFLNAMFNRIYFQISMANEFLRQTTDEKVNSRAGVTDDLRTQIKMYRAEVRFLRALSYYHGIDMFGNIPIVGEDNPVGDSAPGQPSTKFQEGRTAVFKYIEDELNAVVGDMGEPGELEYPRATKAAAYMLLAKMYLNSEVYTTVPKYTECLTALNKVLAYNFTLEPKFHNLFLADNTNNNEFIFAVAFDGLHTQTYGGTTFLVHASVGGSMDASAFGISSGGWAGTRVTSNIVDLFTDPADIRGNFYTNGQTKVIANTPNTSFNEGFAYPKFQNVNSDGTLGVNSTFVDTDFAVFRLADAYLMYAEAVLRNGTGGDITTALGYVNQIRTRAHATTLAQGDMDLNFIIDERARELAWECHRRSDLVRFGLFTTSPTPNPRSIWPWKGNVDVGKETDIHLNVYPIPSPSLTANPKLVQNPNYN